MKSKLKSCLVRRLLPLLGAAIFQLPVLAQAVEPLARPTGSVARPTGPLAPTPFSGPDLKVENACAVNGPQSVLCTVTVKNIGGAPSLGPLSIVDTSTVNAPTSLLAGHGGSLIPTCSPGPGGPIQTKTCTANVSLAPGESKFAFFGFGFGQGGSLTNCATVTQATPPSPKMADRDPSNNTNICASVVVPAPPPPVGADLNVTNTCALDPGHGPQAVLCTVAVHNSSTNRPSGSPVTLTSSPVSPPPGTLYTSSSGSFACTAAAGPVAASMPCVYNNSIPSGQTVSASLYFNVVQGGTFQNCASVTQGMWVDPSPGNNSNQCASVVVPAPVPVAGVFMTVPTMSFLDFGNVKLGTSPAWRTITLGNATNSNAPLTITVPNLNAPFSVSPSGAFTINPGQSKSFNLYFGPSQTGTFNPPPWLINHNATNQANPFYITVRGSGSNF